MKAFYVTATIATLVIAYQALIIVPQQKIDSIERQHKLDQQEETFKGAMKKNEYDACIEESYNMYIIDWNSACGLENKEDGCSLPAYRANELGDDRQTNEDECLAIFKAWKT